MICEECNHLVTLSAMSIGICDKCGKEILSPHIPAYDVCEECAEKYGLCEQCGKQLIKDGDAY
jgi:hypothetical protein